MANNSSEPPIRIRSEEILADDWAKLTKVMYDLRGSDGVWRTHVHQTYDRGNGATILPYDPARGTVLLVRQFRLPAYVSGHDGWLIETCAGRLDREDPETGIRREAEEELGYRFRHVRLVYDAFMSPGSVTERIACFVAEYSPEDRISAGGGAEHEGEDIEVLELSFADALARVASGEIADGKTIILLQYAKLAGLLG
jgi:nudix-type nucleoside diphosphatase (YffH/AdpP family)